MPQHDRTGPVWTARRLRHRAELGWVVRRNPPPVRQAPTNGRGEHARDADRGSRPLTTVEATIRPAPGRRYRTLVWGPGEPHQVRDDLGVGPGPRRATERRSLLYFAQHTDAHLCDTQSPGRLEAGERFAWAAPGTDAGHRPQEHATVQVFDQMVRATNAVTRSPVSGAPMAFLISTGDNTDNRQYGELRWFIDTLDGGTVTPNTGGPGYEGAQASPHFGWVYHPDDPSRDPYGRYGFPRFPGLLGSAIEAFDAAGSAVPWLAVLGNHDVIWQGSFGNQGRIRLGDLGERLSGSEFKPTDLRSLGAAIAAACLRDGGVKDRLDRVATRRSIRVTADPVARRPLTPKDQVAEYFVTAFLPGPVGHGFTESNLAEGTAYWARPHGEEFLLIGLDTNNHTSGSEGRMGPRQRAWLDIRLAEAADLGRRVIVFSHHNSETMTNTVDDRDDPGRATDGEELAELFAGHPSVILWVNGHAHENQIRHHHRHAGGAGGFWEVCTASCIDFGQQSRTFEVFDNGDATLSILTTVLDHAAPLSVASRNDGRYSSAEIASISRELASNDARWVDPWEQRGRVEDRNVEMVVSGEAALGLGPQQGDLSVQ